MIRKDLQDIDEETFINITLPVSDVIKKYVEDNILYDYIAFYLATHYKMDAMWESTMSQEVNTAIESLCNFEGIEFDYEKIKDILRAKHQIDITNEKPLEIKEL